MKSKCAYMHQSFMLNFLQIDMMSRDEMEHIDRLLIVITHKHNVLLCVKLAFRCCDYH